MGVLERDFARLKEKVEVLLGERGAAGRRAVRLEEVTRTVDRAVTAVKTIGRVAWDNVTGKPETFPPTAHTHPITAVTGLEEALANKASSSHTHAWSAIDDKPAEFPPESHTHDFGEITGTVTVAWGDISGKPSTFPPEAHSHATSDVTGLDAALAGKSDAGHTHAWNDITSKPSTFTPSTHTHATSEVTGLDVALGNLVDMITALTTQVQALRGKVMEFGFWDDRDLWDDNVKFIDFVNKSWLLLGGRWDDAGYWRDDEPWMEGA